MSDKNFLKIIAAGVAAVVLGYASAAVLTVAGLIFAGMASVVAAVVLREFISQARKAARLLRKQAKRFS